MLFLIAFLLTYTFVRLITPSLIKYSVKFDFLDKPTDRKTHKKPAPLMGGVGILIGFSGGYLIFIRPINTNSLLILLAAIIVFFIGFVDDWHKTQGKEFAELPRLIIQIVASILVFYSGVMFKGFTNPFTNTYVLLPVFVQLFLSITWLVGVTTVINWSDGLDGLSGGLATISASTLFVVALAKSQHNSAMMSIILVGSLLGFLKYNKFPAQIFIGDSGANFAGFILGIIALNGAFKQATLLSLFIPILALGVPIIDNLYVVINRIIKGRPIHKADNTQLHHRLLSLGINQRHVVRIIILISVCLSLCSIILLLLKI